MIIAQSLHAPSVRTRAPSRRAACPLRMACVDPIDPVLPLRASRGVRPLRPWRPLLLLLILSAALFGQHRALGALDPTGTRWLERAPCGQVLGTVELPFAVRRARADGVGRLVFCAAHQPSVLFLDSSGFHSLTLPGSAIDAIPDGGGGAYALVAPVGEAEQLMHLQRGLAPRVLCSLLGRGVTLRRVAPDCIVVAFATGGGGGLERLHLPSGQLLQRWALPLAPTDLCVGGPDELWVAGGLQSGLLCVAVESGFRVRDILATGQRTLRVCAFRGKGLGVQQFESFELLLLDAGGAVIQSMDLQGMAQVETTSTGGLLVRDPAALAAYVIGASGRLQGGWSNPGVHAAGDPMGMDSIRLAGLHGDEDGDGHETLIELDCGSDPRRATSIPFGVLQAGPVFEVIDQRGAGVHYCLLLGLDPSALSVSGLRGGQYIGWALQPGWVFDRPVGVLRGLGRARVHGLQSAPFGLWIGGLTAVSEDAASWRVFPPRPLEVF